MRKIPIVLSVLLLLTIGLLTYIHFFSGDKKFSIVFFNVGQGDAALIRLENGTKILVDCGQDRKILSKLGKYLPFFDREIDYLIISHPDADHYGGCVDVLKRYEVKNIVTNGTEKKDDQFWIAWNNTAKKEVEKIITIIKPEVWNLEGNKFEFLAPDDSLNLDLKNADNNNRSVVFKFKNSFTSVLFAGDMEEILEKALVEKYCGESADDCPELEAEILKVGHHGSDSSTGEILLEVVSPDTAIISVGKNKFGHPSLRAMRRLERAGADILRTDEEGDVVIR